MATLVKSFAIQGIDAYPVDIETKHKVSGANKNSINLMK